MSVLFLDIDGVLNSAVWSAGLSPEYSGTMISTVLMFNLNTVIAETGCDIVVSSDWRRSSVKKDLNAILRDSGLRKDIIGVTPYVNGKKPTYSPYYSSSFSNLEEERVQEIKFWLDDNPADTWIAIDDMDLAGKGGLDPDRFVHTTYVLGMTDDLAAQAIRKLSPP
jgi:hypothetical protein